MKPSTDNRKIFLLVISLIALTAVAFHPVLQNGFVNYDDPGYITQNPNVKSGLSIKSLQWAFSSVEQSNYHPLTWISHIIDYQLFGANPFFHHLIGLLIHICSSVMLFLLLRRSTNSVWKSYFVALVFALHPLHVESVAWASERKDLLSGLFWMLTLYSYIIYRESEKRPFYFITLVLFTLGLLSKPMAITLPFVLILFDYWPLRRITLGSGERKKESSRKGVALWVSFRKKIPFFILSAISGVVTYLAQQGGGSMAEAGLLSFSDRLSNAVVSYLGYIYKTFYPLNLAVFYPHPAGKIDPILIVLAFAIIAMVTAAVWRFRAKHPYLMVGWLWFLGTLVPVIGIIQVGLQGMADRYMYLPIIGLSLILAWWLPEAAPRAGFRSKHLFSFLFVASLLGMLLLSVRQSSHWKNSSTLFEHAISVTEDNDVAYANLGVDFADSLRHGDAVVQLEKALRIRPKEVIIRSNLAKSLASSGQYDKALVHYKTLLSQVEPDPRLYFRIAEVHADLSEYEEAVSFYLKSLQLDSANIHTRNQLAEVYAYMGNYPGAVSESRAVLEADPANSKAHNILGIVAGRQGNYELAEKELIEAIRLDLSNPDLFRDLGILYEKVNRPDKSEEAYKKAIALNQKDAGSRRNLALLYFRGRRYEEAEEELRKIISLNPGASSAIYDLAKIYESQGKMEKALEQYGMMIQIDKNNIEAIYSSGRILTSMAAYDAAEERFREVLRLSPGNREARIELDRISGLRKDVKK